MTQQPKHDLELFLFERTFVPSVRNTKVLRKNSRNLEITTRTFYVILGSTKHHCIEYTFQSSPSLYTSLHFVSRFAFQSLLIFTFNHNTCNFKNKQQRKKNNKKSQQIFSKTEILYTSHQISSLTFTHIYPNFTPRLFFYPTYLD